MSFFIDDQENVKVGNIVKLSVGILVSLVFILGSWTIINPGQVGLVIRLGSVNRSISQGFNLKWPLVENVKKINVQTQKEQTQSEAASSDLQNVKTTIAVNYNINAEKVEELYTKVGLSFGATIIDPAIQEVLKSVTAKFTAEQLITKRNEVTDDIRSQLATKLALNDITVTGVSIVNFDFSKSFNDAIEAKVTAEQNALAAKNKLDQVKYEADQRVSQAQGEAEAIKIQASAIQAQGGAEYIQLQAIAKWNGILPQYVTAGSAMPFVNVK